MIYLAVFTGITVLAEFCANIVSLHLRLFQTPLNLCDAEWDGIVFDVFERQPALVSGKTQIQFDFDYNTDIHKTLLRLSPVKRGGSVYNGCCCCFRFNWDTFCLSLGCRLSSV